MRHRVFVHVVWATRNRAAQLTLPSVEFLAGFLARICREEDSTLIQFGAVRTHVHLLVRSHPARAMSRTIQRMKGGSSYYGRREHGLQIRWHQGYSLDSVSLRAVPRVADYVANQHVRHPMEAIPGCHPRTGHIRGFLESLEADGHGGPNRFPHGGS
jgi:REP element-mobilizing transposase RayT